jgi:hypothetical protein
MAGMIELIFTTPMFWLSLLVVPLTALLPDIVGKVSYTGIKPSETELVILAEKGNYNPAPYLDHALEKLRKETKALIEPIQEKIGRGKSRSPSDDIHMRERQSTRGSGRGYAFSQEEDGCVTQTELVKKYENRGSATSTRYDNHQDKQQHELDSSNVNSETNLGKAA